ncbi:response regulator [Parasphingorhabdus sp. JC815]|uniref:response regulator n=1 Tax=Parasphingorhabdus sp. JC815 TaxID=3232140 RepID=UPI0034585B27
MPLATTIKPHLPYLRRYARALTGSQTSGDAYVRATLEAIIADPDSLNSDGANKNVTPRVQLHKVFHRIWETSNVDPGNFDSDTSLAGNETIAKEDKLRKIAPIGRQILLLTALEGFSLEEVAQITNVEQDSVNGLLEDAITDIDQEIRTNVLIIEDETLISMELAQIVTDLGHTVSGTAITHTEALKEVARNKPGLVLADIQLADGSSGIDAVKDILEQFSVPVIFVTAFPERLLTGERPEPTFLITKPFQPNAIRAAISQAMFFTAEGHEIEAQS